MPVNGTGCRPNLPGSKVPSWGFNQIDEKGAFVESHRVHYGNWGENYGLSLAHSEDVESFRRLTEGAGKKRKSRAGWLSKSIISEAKKLTDPIIICSYEAYSRLANGKARSNFIPRYLSECPSTKLSSIPGFAGVFNAEGRSLPTFHINVAIDDLKQKILLADLKDFVCWHQYRPIDEPSDEEHVYDHLLIDVVDLNVEDERRIKILEGAPSWLNEKPNKDRYLRSHVIVKVYQKFEIEIREPSAATLITISD